LKEQLEAAMESAAVLWKTYAGPRGVRAMVTILIDSRTAKANDMLHSITLAKIVQDNKRDN
jgi:hypothetical protein